jgi:glutaconate CoA-transferase subunit A
MLKQEVLKRKSLVIDEKEAVSHIEEGMTIAVGGFLLSSHPMALVRQLIKRGAKNLTLIPANSSSLEADILIGAGCVRRIITSYCGAERYAPICPLFRVFAEQGKLEVYEVDESHYYSALKAAALELPFFPDRAGVGTDFPKVNPNFKLFKDPLKGEPLLAIPPIAPDVALLYAAYSDPYGNIQPLGTGFGDRMIWLAAKKVFVQVEKIIKNEEVKKFPERTAYFEVDGIVRAPYGSHPFAGPGYYIEDGEHIREYLAAAEVFAKEGDRSKYDAYLKKYIYDIKTHTDYLERVGLRQLLALHEDIGIENM